MKLVHFTKCNICNKNIRPCNYPKHSVKCVRLQGSRIKYNIEFYTEGSKCLECGKVFSKRGIKPHYRNLHTIKGQLHYKNLSNETRKLLGVNRGRPKSLEYKKRLSLILKQVPGHPHTEETKSKIRVARLLYMKQHPENTAWRNRYSYPEKGFNRLLGEFGLVEGEHYYHNYLVFPYRIDFAFLGHNIAIEIDGSQHWKNPRQVESDKKKDQLLKSMGWEVYRIPATEVTKNYLSLKIKFQDLFTQISQSRTKASSPIFQVGDEGSVPSSETKFL